MEKYKNPALSPAERAEDLLGRMTLEEKVAQTNIIRGVEYAEKPDKRHHCSVEYGSDFKWEDIKNNFSDFGVGFVHDVYSEPAVLNKLQRYMVKQTRLGIPCIFTGEALHGLGAVGTSNFPMPICLAAGFDEEMTEKIGRYIAAETRSRGINEILAPVLDVARDPRWGRMEETFGEDTYLCRKMGAAVVRGESHCGNIADESAVICEPKHFCGYGVPEGGSNCQNARVGEREVRECFLPVFKEAFEAGAKNVMISYNAIDGDVMITSRRYMTDILKNELEMPGYSRADWGAISHTVWHHHLTESREKAARMSMNAGLDTQGCLDFTAPDWQRIITQAVRAGLIDEARLDDAVRRILTVKFEAGLFEKPYTDEQKHLDTVCCKEHDDASLKAAEQGIVMLKNSGVLPLDTDKYSCVALIGPFSKKPTEGGYSAISTRKVSGILEELQAAIGDKVVINQADGCEVFREVWPDGTVVQPHLIREERERMDADMDAAIDAVEKSDIAVIVCGDIYDICGEGRDRATLSLYGQQSELIRRAAQTGKPIVLVLLNGRPAVLAEEEKLSDAILVCWNGGDFASKAVVNTLIGKNNPAGRLPVSFPSGEGRIPCYYSMLPGGAERVYVEGDKKALYTFGHGLSYSEFSYSNILTEQTGQYDFKVSVDVENTSSIDGDEVVQLYVTDVESTVATSDLLLKGFSRIHLAAGEKKTVSFTLGYDDFKLFTPDCKFTVEPGEFRLSVGASHRDIRCNASIFVK